MLRQLRPGQFVQVRAPRRVLYSCLRRGEILSERVPLQRQQLRLTKVRILPRDAVLNLGRGGRSRVVQRLQQRLDRSLAPLLPKRERSCQHQIGP